MISGSQVEDEFDEAVAVYFAQDEHPEDTHHEDAADVQFELCPMAEPSS